MELSPSYKLNILAIYSNAPLGCVLCLQRVGKLRIVEVNIHNSLVSKVFILPMNIQDPTKISVHYQATKSMLLVILPACRLICYDYNSQRMIHAMYLHGKLGYEVDIGRLSTKEDFLYFSTGNNNNLYSITLNTTDAFTNFVRSNKYVLGYGETIKDFHTTDNYIVIFTSISQIKVCVRNKTTISMIYHFGLRKDEIPHQGSIYSMDLVPDIALLGYDNGYFGLLVLHPKTCDYISKQISTKPITSVQNLRQCQLCFDACAMIFSDASMAIVRYGDQSFQMIIEMHLQMPILSVIAVNDSLFIKQQHESGMVCRRYVVHETRKGVTKFASNVAGNNFMGAFENGKISIYNISSQSCIMKLDLLKELNLEIKSVYKILLMVINVNDFLLGLIGSTDNSKTIAYTMVISQGALSSMQQSVADDMVFCSGFISVVLSGISQSIYIFKLSEVKGKYEFKQSEIKLQLKLSKIHSGPKSETLLVESASSHTLRIASTSANKLIISEEKLNLDYDEYSDEAIWALDKCVISTNKRLIITDLKLELKSSINLALYSIYEIPQSLYLYQQYVLFSTKNKIYCYNHSQNSCKQLQSINSNSCTILSHIEYQLHLAVQQTTGGEIIIFTRSNILNQIDYIFQTQSTNAAHLTPNALIHYTQPALIDPNQLVKIPLMLTFLQRTTLFTQLQEPLLIFEPNPKHALITLKQKLTDISIKLRLISTYHHLRKHLKHYAAHCNDDIISLL